MHRIRLSAAWMLESADPAVDTAPSRIHLPCPIDKLSARNGEWLLKRRFHRPTGLTESSRIQLAFLVQSQAFEIRLNGAEIPLLNSSPADPGVAAWAVASATLQPVVGIADNINLYDVTAMLQPFNQLDVQFHPASDVTGVIPIIAAWLQIEDPR